MKSPQSTQGSIADILAEASLKLDDALAALDGGTASRLPVSRLRALADNTHCLNTGCGGTPERRLEQLSDENWDYLMTVNATGAFNMIQAVLPQMRAQGDGLIINISSISGLRASTLAGAAYSASKHALNALSKVVGQEEEQHGIRSTIISPGDINTPLLDKRPVPVSAEQRAKILQPDDIAAAVLFVATLPAHVCVPELVIKPVGQMYS